MCRSLALPVRGDVDRVDLDALKSAQHRDPADVLVGELNDVRVLLVIALGNFARSTSSPRQPKSFSISHRCVSK
jgi:hypothetical protein